MFTRTRKVDSSYAILYAQLELNVLDLYFLYHSTKLLIYYFSNKKHQRADKNGRNPRMSVQLSAVSAAVDRATLYM